MNYLKTLLFILISSNFLFAQNQKIEITGTVLDKNSQNPVEFATVMIGDNKTKTAITGVTTELDGEFKVETNATDFYIEISFIGFENKTITEFSIKNGKVSLGQIYMSENNQELEEVVVRAEK